MVLLDQLVKHKELTLVVGHVDHGIRQDSGEDAEFVRNLADKHNLKFESIRLELGVDTGEDAARTERYNFLRQICKKNHAAGIILAHHQDDIFETIFINLIRGTGWRGLSSLRSHDEIIRPMLAVTKQAIKVYAEAANLVWREDSTNEDPKYLRNFVRHTYMPALNTVDREALLDLWKKQCRLTEDINREVEAMLPRFVTKQQNSEVELSRYWMIMSPYEISDEIVRAVLLDLGTHGALPSQRKLLVIFARTAKPGATLKFHKDFLCRATRSTLIVCKA